MEVALYLYDLSKGLARQLSPMFLGQQIEGIWHTGVVVFGVEYYYGGGIQRGQPEHTAAGQPLRKISLGTTQRTRAEFEAFLGSISHRFTVDTYSFLRHNCNNFSDELAVFLTGSGIPDFITGLPETVFSTPMGQMIRPMIERFEVQMRQGMVPWDEQPSPAEAPLQVSVETPRSQPCLLVKSKGAEQLLSILKAKMGRFRVESTNLDEKQLAAFLDGRAELDPESVALFDSALQHWPMELMGSILSCFRLLVAKPQFATVFLERHASGVDALIRRTLTLEASLECQLVALSSISNTLAHQAASKLAASPQLHDALVGLYSHQHTMVRLLSVTAMFNCSLLFGSEVPDTALGYASFLCEAVGQESNKDVQLRQLNTLTELMRCSDEIAQLVAVLDVDLDRLEGIYKLTAAVKVVKAILSQ